MKHLLSSTLALAALVMLGACSSDDDIATATGGVTNNNENVPVAFQNYVGRDITTRGTIEDITTIGTKGFGVFAYDSEGDYTSGTGTYANFSDNFMSNQQVTASSSVATNSTAWTYSPLKYWPQASTERISFLAYAPYTASAPAADKGGVDPALVSSTGTSTGDLTYIKYTVGTNPAEHVDLMWNTTNALNQYLYQGTDGSYVKSNNFNSTLANATSKALRQNIKFSHATARVAFVVTSGVLSTKQNFTYTAVNKNETTDAGISAEDLADITKYTKTENTETSNSDAQLTVKKVTLMGKPSSSQVNGTQITGTVEGAFYKYGYLNLNNNTDGKTADLTSGSNSIWKPDWKSTSTDEVSFTFDSFVDGTLGNFATDATNTINNAKAWTPTSNTNNVIKGSTNITTTTYTDVSDNSKVYTNVVVSSGSANAIGTKSDEYLFVIPEDFTASENDLYAYMEYELVYTDYKKDPEGWILTHKKADDTKYNKSDLQDASFDATQAKEDPKNYYAYGKLSKNLKGGHAYVIVANIGGDITSSDTPDVDPDKPTSFNPIQFTVEEVTGWGDEEDPDASL